MNRLSSSLRAGLGVILSLLLYVGLLLAGNFAIGWLLRVAHISTYLTPGLNRSWLLLGEVKLVCAVLLATLVMQRIERRPLRAYGWGGVRPLRTLLMTFVVGAVYVSLLVGLLAACGLAQVHAMAWSWPMLGSACIWLVFFSLVAFNEESILRGYPLFRMLRTWGPLPAVLVSSLLFGAAHLGNAGENPLGIATAVVVGLVYGLVIVRTGSLLWAIGFHAGWDWTLTCFWGAADSGVPTEGSVMQLTPSGPAWLSGGAAGPEGSLLCVVLLIVLGLAIAWRMRRRETPKLDASSMITECD
ncbi:CPBP family intramembrane glutamic endopeptidase [Dyella choica]|uniref:CPBP family intramembrane metalloprotease n=1 Tax=Dyella choica TaxID=1927959 RepID=A0A3S0PKF7_9GAMM|nr:CPBP family intramembrane glutamic endopeptidase [Dyella choica]RUL78391.1 CPBP family intramembrane metalloprotease [Dyella choica]